MLSNYLKTSFRNILRTRAYSLVNIVGLAVGMAACLLILHYVRFEKSYDRFHDHSDRIYRLRYERTSEEGTAVLFASCCPPAADFIRGVYPEVEEIARIYHAWGVMAVKDRDLKFTEERLFYAEPEFFRILKVRLIEGDPLETLAEPNRAFLSATASRKYFGGEPVVGRTITLDGTTDFKVAGIYADFPPNSHFKPVMLLSFKTIAAKRGENVMRNWGYTGFFTYLRLKPDADPAALEAKLGTLVEAQCGEMMNTYRLRVHLKLQRLEDIHLDSHFLQEYEPNGNRGSVGILALAAAFIMFMAWVNYINLSTARALTRSKEVGLRKVVGASRPQLLVQFLLETFLLNLFAAVLALALLAVNLPFFRRLTGIPAEIRLWSSPAFWISAAAVFAGGILLSGAYPAAALSAFRPATVLRTRPTGPGRGARMRKILVMAQYAIALALLTGAFTVGRQVGFMKSRDVGFDKERILLVKAPRVRDETFREKYVVFKEEVRRNPEILKAGLVTEPPGRQIYWDNGGIFRAGQDSGMGKNYMIIGVDADALDVFGFKLVQGRNFSREFGTDDKALILNQTAVRWMGFGGDVDAIGQRVDYWGEIYTIIGVLADFHQQSPKAAFEPQIYRLMPYGHPEWGRFAMKTGPGPADETIRRVGETYRKLFPGNPFEFVFLDDYYDEQYRDDIAFGRVVVLFSGLAVLITALGVFGMSSFQSLQRTKEIGIRKVLGASTAGILRLLGKDFLSLAGISLVLAWPLTFWGVGRWLRSFAWRMEIDAWLFLAPVLLVSAVTAATMSVHSLRAALSDPVAAIAHE
jgi:putative ABC transport system permease protein